MSKELINKRTRTEFRELLVGWTLREIEDEFEGEYIALCSDYEPGLSGQRRTLVEQYYASLDFSNWSDVQKLLHVYENILNRISNTLPDVVTRLNNFLQRDGYVYKEGRIAAISGGLPPLNQAREVAVTFNTSYMAMQISRIEASIDSDPDLAVGSAKELVETCCKTILADRGLTPSKNAEVTELTKMVVKELKLVPDNIPDAAKGADAIKRLLSNLGSITQCLAEIRNLYGSGHGKHGRASSVKPRHAKLAVGAATTLVVFLYETHLETQSTNQQSTG
jgi:hypothetical protein